MEKKPKILAIDDEENFVGVFKEYFEERGYNITAVSTGVDGLQKLDSNNFDIVLVDLKMGGVSGEEIINRVKELHEGVSVIVISAFNDGDVTKNRLLSEGVHAFIEKPLSSLKDLEKVVLEAYNQ